MGKIRQVIKALTPNFLVEGYRAHHGIEFLIPKLMKRYCSGSGIEIGAGPNPYCSPQNTVFLDRHDDNAKGTVGADLVADASAIPKPDDSFDFLLSAHCLEHVSDTIKTLYEWKRVLKPGGALFLILPHAKRTFDRHRALTPLAHHIEDFGRSIPSLDRSHVAECDAGMRQLEDLQHWEDEHRKVWGVDFWDWEHRLENDAFHYHVWTQDEVISLLHYVGMQIAYVHERVPERDDSFVIVAYKRTST